MIVAEQVQKAVEHEDTHFGLNRVSKGGRLFAGAFQRDGEVAERSRGGAGREAQDIGGVVVTKEVAIQAAESGVRGEETSEGTALRNLPLEGLGELAQRTSREARPVGFKQEDTVRVGHKRG